MRVRVTGLRQVEVVYEDVGIAGDGFLVIILLYP